MHALFVPAELVSRYSAVSTFSICPSRDVYGVTFHIFEKTHVAGPEAHPLFRYISQALPPEYGKGLSERGSTLGACPQR